MADDITRVLTGAEKVALLIMQLEENAAGKILKSMNVEEVSKISFAMSKLGRISSDISQKIVEEAYDYLSSDKKNIVGDAKNTKDTLTKIFGEEEAKKIMNDIDCNIWNKLARLDPEVLTSYLCNETPQIIALVLQKLPDTHLPKIITRFPKNLAIEVMLCFTGAHSVNKEIVNEIESTISSDFNSVFVRDSSTLVADLLDNLDKENKAIYLKELEKRDKVFISSVKSKMFAFENIAEITDIGIQAIFRHVDKNTLTFALKGANADMQKLFFQNMSERAANIIRDDMEDLGPVDMDEIETAQHEVSQLAKQLLLAKMIKRKS
ncbi:MAG: hypothetical protein HRK26_01600 [Rickettsiaceae bacterium H1]|nr:hypothetical protein [Rickettsiaceae bacterium H1]